MWKEGEAEAIALFRDQKPRPSFQTLLYFKSHAGNVILGLLNLAHMASNWYSRIVGFRGSFRCFEESQACERSRDWDPGSCKVVPRCNVPRQNELMISRQVKSISRLLLGPVDRA